MKQKLGLVCTLIHEPDLVILDEPTTGVDPVSRRDFWTILAELLRERGMTALVSTAYMDEAARFHRLSFLSSGKVVASGTPAEVQALVPGSMVTFEATPQMEAIARLKTGYKQVEALGPLLRVFTEHTVPAAAAQALTLSLGDITPLHLRVDEPELEDVFVALLLRQADQPPSAEMPRVTALAANHGLAIEAKGLIRDFGTFRAVDHVSFQVKSGQIFGLLGPTEQGKTTVIKMFTGLCRPPGARMGRRGGHERPRAGHQGTYRLYVPGLFALPGFDGRGEHSTVCRNLWPCRAQRRRHV